MQSEKTPASQVALGGVLAALAVVIMAMGTLIPVATFVCPVICMLLLKTVRTLCGRRTAWGWYGAVALLGLLMAPNKEAAAVFACLGYYPIVKPYLDRKRARWLWKGLLFNAVVLLLYGGAMKLMGMDAVVREYTAMGTAMTVVMLVLGNVTFFLLDRLLGMRLKRRM